MANYKTKYKKYKKKYLKEKNMIGGSSCLCTYFGMTKTEFKDLLILRVNENPNITSMDIFIELAHNINKNIPVYAVVGASCNYSYDLKTYGKKKYNQYNLFIDINIKKFDVDKQIDMFTIDYNDLVEKYVLLPQNIINEIHFDKGVSYMTSQQYISIANHLLKPNGNIIYDLKNSNDGIICIYDGQNFYDVESRTIINEKILTIITENKINIDVDNNKVTTTNDYYTTNTLNPQIKLRIIYKNLFLSNERINFDDYINYYNDTYNDFDFKLKYYTYENHTYPLGIYKNLLFDDFKFVYDKMTTDEKHIYFKTNSIPAETKIRLMQKNTNEAELINEKLNKIFFYIVATKKN